MRTEREATSRRVSEPVELARIEALVERARRVPAAYLGVSRVVEGRRQEKLRTFDEREGDRIVLDLDQLRRDHPGVLARFQLREGGQVLGTAQWHIPEAAEPKPRPDPGSTHAEPSGAAASAAELSRIREELAGARAESRHLAEEVRRLRTELSVEQAARQRAEAERDLAMEAADRLRAAREVLRDKLQEAAVEKKESEIAFRLLLDRVPDEVEEVSRLVLGEQRRKRRGG